MPADSDDNLRLEIGHVLFIDIVGYSKLLIEKQKQRLNQLTAIVLATEQVRESTDEQLVRLPTGDGMALVFRQSAEEPARCAVEISQALKAHPEIPVRMGVHSGPVSEVSDVNARTNIAGAGINIAQRVMDCGDAGHILLSKHVAEDLEQYGHWQPQLHDLGDCEVKHGVRLGLVNLYTDGVGNPSLPKKLQALRQRKRMRWAAAAALLLLALLAAALLLFMRKPAPPAVLTREKSVAVLPFDNMSRDPDNVFFTDGVQDQILTALAKVADLKVISRTSVMQYKSGAARNLREIGQQLGVAHLLEGSVQRAGNKVRVNAQLIDARTDAHEWAENYDRPIDDVFAIQSEIAKAIADQLQAKLSPAEKTAIEQPPTNDIPAFDLYSRARTLMLNVTFTSVRIENTQRAIEFLNQALARDPNFFLAYCRLAEAQDYLYFLSSNDHTPARLALAEAAVQRVVQLQPASGEAHLVLAQHRYRGYRDYDGARAELALAERFLPNEPLIPQLASFIDRRRGRWDDSVRNAERAIELDPGNVFLMQQTALTYQHVRRYAQMAAIFDRALAVAPKSIETRIARAQVELHWHADTRPLHGAIDQILAEDPSAAAAIAENWMNVSLCERDATAARRALAALDDHTFGESTVQFNSAFAEGLIARLAGDMAAAQMHFAAARMQQAESVRSQPDYAPALCSLGVMDAILGRKEEALSEGRRALELLPVSQDALTGSEIAAVYAIICAWSGERELALRQLEAVTKLPCYLSYGQLRLQPYWDPLRGDPRFEKIVAALAPKEAK